MNYEEKYHRVYQYLKQYPGIFFDFDEAILDYVEYLDQVVFVPDICREIYDEVGIIPDNKNLYLGFLDLLKRHFPIEKNHIIEVGGGILPRLGKRIHLLQTSGSITIYDPRLSVYEQDEERFILKRKMFSSKEPLNKTDLLIGLMPCEGANVLLKTAFEHRIDFMLGLCEGGPHGEPFDYYQDEDEWLDATIYDAKYQVKANDMGTLKTLSLKQYGDKYPVIYNQR